MIRDFEDSSVRESEMIRLEMSKFEIANRLFDTKNHKEYGINVELIKSYSECAFDFIEADLDVAFFKENPSVIRSGTKTRYLNILADVVANSNYNIKRAKLIVTDTKNYLHFVNVYRGKELNLIVMMENDDVEQGGRNPNRFANAAVQLVDNLISRWKNNNQKIDLGSVSSFGDDNKVKVRVLSYENILLYDMMQQENRYVEKKFDLDQDKNESIFINVFRNLEKYEVANITEDYIADVIDSRLFSLSNAIQSGLISKDDDKYLSSDIRVLKVRNNQQSYDMDAKIVEYIETFLKGRELDRFYTEKNIYIVIGK